jgi:hypothetical protein
MKYLKTLILSLLVTGFLVSCGSSRCSRGFSDLQEPASELLVVENRL